LGRQDDVAPRAGAWIETVFHGPSSRSTRRSPPARGRGLKQRQERDPDADSRRPRAVTPQIDAVDADRPKQHPDEEGYERRARGLLSITTTRHQLPTSIGRGVMVFFFISMGIETYHNPIPFSPLHMPAMRAQVEGTAQPHNLGRKTSENRHSMEIILVPHFSSGIKPERDGSIVGRNNQ
jgi:hypothetical protein